MRLLCLCLAFPLFEDVDTALDGWMDSVGSDKSSDVLASLGFCKCPDVRFYFLNKCLKRPDVLAMSYVQDWKHCLACSWGAVVLFNCGDALVFILVMDMHFDSVMASC